MPLNRPFGKALKLLACRQSIIAEVENSLAAQYAAMPQEELHQWHATLQQGLSESSDAHHKAKDYLKQVGRTQLVTSVLSCNIALQCKV